MFLLLKTAVYTRKTFYLGLFCRLYHKKKLFLVSVSVYNNPSIEMCIRSGCLQQRWMVVICPNYVKNLYDKVLCIQGGITKNLYVFRL